MEITQEKKDDLNALLKVRLEKSDYEKEYKDVLKSHSKQLNIPGFRAGKVPVSVVKKRFGKGLLAEEIQKLLDKSIDGYIKENKLDILGQPLPIRDMEVGDWDEPDTFEFGYEMGLAPDFKVGLSEKMKMNFYRIKVDDKMLDEEVDRIRKRFGSVSDSEKASENDMLIGEFVELRKDGLEMEEGIRNKTTIALEYLKDKKSKKALSGAKVGDSIDLDPTRISENPQELMKTLDVDQETAVNFGKRYFRFDVSEVKSIQPADMDEEFLSKVLPEDQDKTEEGLRGYMKENLEKQFERDSEMLFKRDVNRYLSDKLKLKLPDQFLKRYIQLTADGVNTEEEVEANYEEYANGIRWQLIKNRIIEEGEIKVEFQEAIDHVKELLRANYQQYGMPAPEEEELEQSAQRVLSTNQEEMQRVFDDMYEQRIIQTVKEGVKLSEKEVSFDKFKAMAEK